MSMRTRLALGLGSIAAMLLLSSIISVLEYRRMSNYVTDLVADNIRNINVAQKLVSMSDEYNLKVLAAIGEEDSTSVSVPYFDRRAFMEQCDGLRTSISSEEAFPLADSVIYAYSAYMLTSLELPGVMASDFINSRDWYFDRLQPRYNRLRSDIEKLTDAAYADLPGQFLQKHHSRRGVSGCRPCACPPAPVLPPFILCKADIQDAFSLGELYAECPEVYVYL